MLWGTTGVVVRQLQDSADLGSAAIGAHRLGIAAVVLALLTRPSTVVGGGALMLTAMALLYLRPTAAAAERPRAGTPGPSVGGR
jgi:hypothetical protein